MNGNRTFRDVILLAGWTFTYAALIKVFDLLTRLERSPKKSGPAKGV
jgi:hypothetical protein